MDLIVRLAIVSLRPVERFWSARIQRRRRRYETRLRRAASGRPAD